jgi:hypothetical protein
MAMRNPRWGAERIRGELLKVGVRVSLFEATSSISRAGCSARSAVRIGGSTSTATTSLAVTRTVPAIVLPTPEAARRSAPTPDDNASAWGRSVSAASVGESPRGAAARLGHVDAGLYSRPASRRIRARSRMAWRKC